MGNITWQKLIVLLCIASQIAAKKWRMATDDSQMILHDAVIKGEDDLGEINFSNFEGVEFVDPQVETFTIKLQAPMANVKRLEIKQGTVVTVHVAPNFEDVLIDSNSVRNVIINPASAYSTVEFAVKNSAIRGFPQNLNAMKKLRVLNLFNNFIETVDLADLNGLKNLEEIRLVHNKIKNVNFFQAVFPKLNIIDLGYNRLKDIRMDHFTAPLLSNLDLSQNQLEVVNISQFNVFNNLHAIHLNDNQIKEITSNTVTLPKLDLFTIASNRLNYISFEDWNTPALKVVIIKANQLKQAQGFPKVFPALERVWLFPNSFTEQWLAAALKELNDRNIEIMDYIDMRY